tara:strand:+ start:468 stop:899 length:432 start_codon:yes stop_codon:yes gene_type:complete
MTRKSELVLEALFGVLQGIDGPKVLRNAILPERVPAPGIIILRDGEPGEPEALMSPPEYIYEHFAEAEVVVDAPTSAQRDSIFDGLLEAIGTAIAANRTLGGLCDYVLPAAPEPAELAIEGAPGFKAAIISIALHYGTADPLA